MDDLTRSEKIARYARFARRAALLLQNHGWTQGVLGSPRVGFCTLGAIGYIPSDYEAQAVIVSMIEKSAGKSVVRWNDDVCQNKEEAIAMLIGIAEELERQSEEAKTIPA